MNAFDNKNNIIAAEGLTERVKGMHLEDQEILALSDIFTELNTDVPEDVLKQKARPLTPELYAIPLGEKSDAQLVVGRRHNFTVLLDVSREVPRAVRNTHKRSSIFARKSASF